MIYLYLFWEFLQTGLFAFGGGLATLPFLSNMAARYGWFTQAELANMLAVSEATPGPIGVNMATYCGMKTAGVPGACIATFGLVLPSVLCMLLLASLLARYQESRTVRGALQVLRPASVGLVAAAGWAVVQAALFPGGLWAVSWLASALFAAGGKSLSEEAAAGGAAGLWSNRRDHMEHGGRMKVLGIDPGYATTGFGLLRAERGQYGLLQYGVITTDKELPFAQRLDVLYQDIVRLLEVTAPDAVAVEELFWGHNITTGIGVSHGRGVILLAIAQSGIPLFEYTPMQVKQAVVGYGKAEKRQVMDMTRRLLHMQQVARPDDAADAIAIALCHARSSTSRLPQQ